MRIMLRCCRIVALSCLLLSLSIVGFGQNQPHRGKVNVPFEFSIGGVKFSRRAIYFGSHIALLWLAPQ